VRLVCLGYEAGPGHMALTVAGAGELPDPFALLDHVCGRKFFYCEATTDAGSMNSKAVSFRMGDVPERDHRAKMEPISVA
jgi:hypothetical protein